MDEDAGAVDLKIVQTPGPFLNIWLGRRTVLQKYVPMVVDRGRRYGENQTLKGRGMTLLISGWRGSPAIDIHRMGTAENLRKILVAEHAQRLAKFCMADFVEVVADNENVIGSVRKGEILLNFSERSGGLTVRKRIHCEGVDMRGGSSNRVNVLLRELTNGQKDMGMDENSAELIARAELTYALLRTKCGTIAKINMQRMIGGAEDAPGAVILYNRSRVTAVERLVESIRLNTDADWSSLGDDDWSLFWNCVAPFPELVAETYANLVPRAGTKTNGRVKSSFHSVSEFLFRIAKQWSRYYSKVRVAVPSEPGTMAARSQLVTAFRVVFDNSLALLGMRGPDRM